MKRYIKPQIQVMAAALATEMLAGSKEGDEVDNGMSKKNPGLFDDEWQSEKESRFGVKIKKVVCQNTLRVLSFKAFMTHHLSFV